MSLTPLRIRGKRGHGRKPAAPQYQPSRSTSVFSNSSSGTKASSASKRSKSGSARPTKKRRKAPPLSNLESLPTELLERIFLEASSIALPRSSPFIAKKLGRYVQLNFALRVLYTPRYWLGSDAPELRSDLLGCRFFDWPFFQELAGRASAVRQKILERNDGVDVGFEEGSYVARDQFPQLGAEIKQATGGQDDVETIPTPAQPQLQQQQQLIFPNLFRHPDEPNRYIYDPTPSSDMHSVRTHIPTKLLISPFTTNKTTLLAHLLLCNAIIDHTLSSAALRGLESAISASKPANSRPSQTTQTPASSTANFTTNRTAALLLTRTLPPRLITTELVRSFVDDSNCDKELVGALLDGRYGKEGVWTPFTAEERREASLDAHDTYLWGWADRADDEIGQWLKEKLRWWASDD